MITNVDITVAERFEEFLFDWDYRTYLLIGGFGSGKSHSIATKLILKCYSEERKIAVIRKTYKSHRLSSFALVKRLLTEKGLLETNKHIYRHDTKVIAKESPMKFIFPNGSEMLFEGLDDVENLKSLDGVTIVWFEEASQITPRQYNNVRTRARKEGYETYFFLSSNPMGFENWLYKTFFVKKRKPNMTREELEDLTIVSPEEFYKKRTLVRKGVYYHHSTVDDNPFAEKSYISDLDNIKEYDPQLYETGRHGKFGAVVTRVLPQFTVADTHEEVMDAVNKLPELNHYTGMDFGFEESYNAVIRMAVDIDKKILYLYNEIYENHVTDDIFSKRPAMQRIKAHQEQCVRNRMSFNPIVADSSAPKDIKYYRQEGFYIRKCDNRGMSANSVGTRIANTKKIKRFHKIVCSPLLENTIAELQHLTYATDKNDEPIFDQFNIDPHTFSAIWYGLDKVTVADVKETRANSYA